MDRDRLVVFSDDWGRHPSSCQHLVSRLLRSTETVWVNTIGTRMPRFSVGDLKKIVAKVRQWGEGPRVLPGNLSVVSPKMFPGFRRQWQRQLNNRSICSAVNAALGPRESSEKRIAVTTIPVTAGLVGATSSLDVDHWVYYCVDDFAEWPGLDSEVMRNLEMEQLDKVDVVIAASEHLRERLSRLGRNDVKLLTHGIDLEYWSEHEVKHNCVNLGDEAGPQVVFWGLIDQRLDEDWCRALARCLESVSGRLRLYGPIERTPEFIKEFPTVVSLMGPVPYADLPGLAREADVLVMPYGDMPVTRAMQPLKFKEYLATGKPVVARALPATMEWEDAADLVEDPREFCRIVMERATGGATTMQLDARKRLESESWDAKAAAFATLIGLNSLQASAVAE